MKIETIGADLLPEDFMAWRRVRKFALLGFLVAAALIAVCINWVDLPLAIWVYENGFDSMAPGLHVFMNIQALITPVALVYMLVFIVKRSKRAPTARAYFWFVTSVSIFVTCEVKNMLKIAFGRTWPRDTSGGDVDLILPDVITTQGYVNDGIHMFNPFAAQKAFTAFPSGTMAVLSAAVIPIWIHYPASRIPLALLSVIVACVMLQTNTHFVSDLVAGAYIGGLIGMVGAAFITRHKAEYTAPAVVS
jgi:hypothetical protein